MNTIETLQERSHSHHFDVSNPISKRNTLYATLLTVVTMVVEIVGGMYYNSMALLADGWHMSSHVLALGMAYLAYVMAAKFANDFRFNFGTYKIEVLGAYTSAMFLLVVAFLWFTTQWREFFNPADIKYQEAISIAVLGLVVNLICAWLLRGEHHHHHHGEEDHQHHHDHQHDMNLKAAYLHVLADALTSILAIIALSAAMIWQVTWLDPVMGIVGSVLVFIWAISLIKQTSKILLDAEMDHPIVEEVIESVNNIDKSIEIHDLHLWKVGKGKYSCILSIDSKENNIEIDEVKRRLLTSHELVHITIEKL